MPLQNYTTTIDAMKTVSEIMQILAGHGARKIQTEYSPAGQPQGITFTVVTPTGAEREYKMDAHIADVKRVLTRQRAEGRARTIKTDDQQAERTAWRNLKDLLMAQMTLLDYEQADLEKLFFADTVSGGKTLFEVREEIPQLRGREDIPECFRRLGFDRVPDEIAEVRERYHDLAKDMHPDAAGSEIAMRDLNQYFAQARAFFEEARV